MSVTENGGCGGNVAKDDDAKRNDSDVTANVQTFTINCKDHDVKRNGDRAKGRHKFVVELVVDRYRDGQTEVLWSRTVVVTIENFYTEYADAFDERIEQARKHGYVGFCGVGIHNVINGVRTSICKKIVPCCECGDLVLLDMFDKRFGQYCSDQCRDERYRREQAESKRRQRAELRGERCCDHCGETYEPKRKGSKFCSTRCRVAANRAIGKGGAS